MKKIISLLMFSIFAATAFAQISLEPPSTERGRNHRGAKKSRRIKRPRR